MKKQIIIDVREPFEYEAGHVEKSLNVPLDKIITGSKILKQIPKDSKIILYCRSGTRSNFAKSVLTSKGYTNIIDGINKRNVEEVIFRKELD